VLLVFDANGALHFRADSPLLKHKHIEFPHDRCNPCCLLCVALLHPCCCHFLALQCAPERVASDLPVLLAALAFATSEARWYFSHAGEALPAPPRPKGAGSLLQLPGSGTHAGFIVPEDPQMVLLLSGCARLYELLVGKCLGLGVPCMSNEAFVLG